MAKKQKEIRVVIKNVAEEPFVKTIPNELEEFQKIVGGYIEVVPYNPKPMAKEITTLANEEGKLEGLEPNLILLPYDIVVGNVFFTRTDFSTGEFVTLTDTDIEQIAEAYGWKINQ